MWGLIVWFSQDRSAYFDNTTLAFFWSLVKRTCMCLSQKIKFVDWRMNSNEWEVAQQWCTKICRPFLTKALYTKLVFPNRSIGRMHFCFGNTSTTYLNRLSKVFFLCNTYITKQIHLRASFQGKNTFGFRKVSHIRGQKEMHTWCTSFPRSSVHGTISNICS